MHRRVLAHRSHTPGWQVTPVSRSQLYCLRSARSAVARPHWARSHPAPASDRTDRSPAVSAPARWSASAGAHPPLLVSVSVPVPVSVSGSVPVSKSACRPQDRSPPAHQSAGHRGRRAGSLPPPPNRFGRSSITHIAATAAAPRRSPPTRPRTDRRPRDASCGARGRTGSPVGRTIRLRTIAGRRRRRDRRPSIAAPASRSSPTPPAPPHPPPAKPGARVLRHRLLDRKHHAARKRLHPRGATGTGAGCWMCASIVAIAVDS